MKLAAEGWSMKTLDRSPRDVPTFYFKSVALTACEIYTRDPHKIKMSGQPF